MTGTDTLSMRVNLAEPVDVAGSAHFLLRNGDDLMDRWDGHSLARILDTAKGPLPVRVTPEIPGCVRVDFPRQAGVDADAVAYQIKSLFVHPTAGWEQLLAADAALGRIVSQAGVIRPMRLFDPTYCLIRSISAQQVNLRWATTLRIRLAQTCGRAFRVGDTVVYHLEPEAIIATGRQGLRELQFSTRKAEYLVAVAEASLDGHLNLERLTVLPTADLVSQLCQIRGVGRWTAEWFAVRVLACPVVVAGDLVVRKSVGWLYDRTPIPTEAQVRTLTTTWGPNAAIAQQYVLEAFTTAHAPRSPNG